jgi:hypothetical protein
VATVLALPADEAGGKIHIVTLAQTSVQPIKKLDSGSRRNDTNSCYLNRPFNPPFN